MAVEIKAYIRDFAVSFLKHSLGIEASTSARLGNSSLGGKLSAFPARPEGVRSAKSFFVEDEGSSVDMAHGKTARRKHIL